MGPAFDAGPIVESREMPRFVRYCDNQVVAMRFAAMIPSLGLCLILVLTGISHGIELPSRSVSLVIGSDPI